MRKAHTMPIKRKVYIEMLSKDLAKFTTSFRQKTIDLSRLDKHSCLDLISLNIKVYNNVKKQVGFVLVAGERLLIDPRGNSYYNRAYLIYSHQKEDGGWENIGEVALGTFTYRYTNQDTVEVKTNAGAFEVTLFERP